LNIRQSSKRRIAVVEPRHDEWYDEWLQNWPRQRSSNAPYLAEDSEAVGHRSGNVCPHGGISVQVDPKITDRGYRLNEVGAYSDQCSIVHGIWCWRLLDVHQRTSVLLVFSWSWLLRIHNATSSTHAETHSCSCSAADGWQQPYICVSSAYRCRQSWCCAQNTGFSASLYN